MVGLGLHGMSRGSSPCWGPSSFSGQVVGTALLVGGDYDRCRTSGPPGHTENKLWVELTLPGWDGASEISPVVFVGMLLAIRLLPVLVRGV